MVDIINHPGHPEKVSAKKKVSWSPAPRLPHILHPWGGISPISKFHYQKKKKTGASKLLEGTVSQNFAVIPQIKLFVCLP